MRYKKIEQAHVEERVVLTDEFCDGCGKPTTTSFVWDHERNEVTIGALLGEVYPSDDMRTAYDLDVCAECFRTKVIPALVSVGLRFRVREVDDDGRMFEVDGRRKGS